MLKGKTLIELTNIMTGKVERYEDENIITNAAQLYISAVAALCGASNANLTNYKRFPMTQGAFGGIKLFESSLEEDAAKWQIPKIAVSKIIGYASTDTTDGTDTRRGSRNMEESTVLENGVQLVWDFATSEANGTISCVCLTSGYGGETCYNLSKTAEWYSDEYSSFGYLLGYDETNDCLITLSGSSGSVYLKKYRVGLNNLRLDEGFCIPTLIYTSPEKISFSGTSGYLNLQVLDSNTLVEINPVPNPNRIIISYYDMTTGNKTKEDTIDVPDLSISYTMQGLILNGYLYLQNDTNNGVYKINLTNTSDVTFFDMPDAKLSATITKLPNGDLVSGNTVFDSNTGAYQTGASLAYAYKYIIEKGGYLLNVKVAGKSFYIDVQANEMMLHSINNLETPVTKTADKTMKITYTLTYSK